jgi:hypothetical protein
MAGTVVSPEHKAPWLKLASDWLALIPIPKGALLDQFNRTEGPTHEEQLKSEREHAQ